MPNLNKVQLMGHLTRDPELRYLPNNTAKAEFCIAISRKWKSKEGDQQEETCFVDCEAFGKTAEIMNQYLKKGRPVYIDGHLRLNQWQDRNSGAKRSKMLVMVDGFQFIDSRPNEQPSHASQQRSTESSTVQGFPTPRANEPLNEDDIPF